MRLLRFSVALISISMALYGCAAGEPNPTGNTTEADASTPDPTDTDPTDTTDASDTPDPADTSDTTDTTDPADSTDTSDAADASDTSDAADATDTESEPDCTDGDTQNGTTPCGLNNEGVFVQSCENGAWLDSDTCTGTDICTNDDSQDGQTPCGINDEGVYVQTCQNGSWIDTDLCTGTDICTNGDSQNSSTACGLNNEGFVIENCTDGAWANSGECTGTDICENGATQAGSELCGLNNEGTLEELCTDGAWDQTENCSGTDVCVNGSMDYQLASCAGGATGAKTLECVGGAWNEETVCPETGNISYSALGRTITFDTVNLGGTGTKVAQVQPGASTSLRVGGWVIDNQTACDTCITQFYVRLNGIMNMCLGSSTGSWSFDENATFTAPTEPGIYYVNPTEGWDWECVGSTGVSTEYNSNTVAILVVAESDDTGGGDDNTCDTSGLTAGSGTAQVQAFNGTVINWASAHNETFTFPAESEHFVSATMHMTLECPDGGCDPWDRYGSIGLNHSSGTNHEIARFITPYAIDASSGYPGSCSWSYDVTPFTHLLRGEQELSLYISTWIGGDQGWKVTVTFNFERGIPELEPYRIVNLWDFGHLVYGNPGNPVTDHLVDQPVIFDEETEHAMVRVTVTGHGQGNTDNAAEFSMRWHEVSAGNSADAWTPWRYDCAQNTCSPQGGNWTYGRAGWCPGDGVWPRDIDVSSEITTNASVAFGYGIEPYENCCRPDNPSCDHTNGSCCISFAGECGWNYTGHTQPNFDLNAQLVLYRCPQ